MLGRNQTIVTEFLLLGFQTLHSFKNLLFTVFLVIYIMTISSNLLIITLVSTSHQLHSPMYFFLAQLSLSDILLTTVIVPNMLRLIWGEGGTMSVAGCISQLHFFASCGAAESLLLTVMSYDRYLAICHPLRYTTIMNFKLRLQLVIWSWLLGFMFILLLILPTSQLQFCDSNVIDHIFCDFAPLVKHSCSDISFLEIEIFVLSIALALLPFVFIIVTYVCIFLTILRIPSTTGRQKAFSTCSSHIFVVCTYYGTVITIYAFPSRGHSFNFNKVLSLLYTVVTPFFNPIIYSLRNQEIEAALRRMFHYSTGFWHERRGRIKVEYMPAVPAMLGKNHTIVTEFLLLGFQNLHNSKIFLFSLFLVTYIMTISSNLLIIALVSTSHQLHSPMYFFLAHLSLSDILLTKFIVPNMLRLIWGEGGTLSVAGCISQLHFFASSVATESLLLTVMSYDRYLASVTCCVTPPL
ncbi:olfactory receptor 1E16-like [Ascaphus truei]|uniref:olfactory receptor 1E16-like n=1 Tax=Ascaphus truei TaxID=8439 RepID=UPI003F59FA40